MKRLLVAISVCLVLVWPAAASPTLTHLTNGLATATNTLTISGVTIAANHVLAVGCGIRAGASGDTVSISDSASETFTTHNATGFSTQKAFIAFVKTVGLSSGSVTVSVTTSNASNVIPCSVDDITNFNASAPEDTAVYAQTANNSSSTPSTTTGVPSQSGDLLYSVTAYGNATMTEDVSWTSLIVNSGNSNGRGAVAEYPGAGSTAVTRAPSLSVSTQWVQNVVGFAPASGGAVVHSLGLLGVGK